MNSILLIGGEGAFGRNISHLNDHDCFTKSDYERERTFPEGYERYILAATVHHNRDNDGSIIQDDVVFTDELKFYTHFVREYITKHPRAVFVYMSTSLIGRVDSAYVRYKRKIEKCLRYLPNVSIVRPYFIADTLRPLSTQDRIRRCIASFYSNELISYSLSVPLWYDIIKSIPGELRYHKDGISTLKQLYTLPDYLFNND